MRLFLKTNQSIYKDALVAESAGLRLLQQSIQDSSNNFLHIPKIIDNISDAPHAQVIDVIKMQYIETCNPNSNHMIIFAKGLAVLHKKTESNYGLDWNNYIGLNPQQNQPSDNWGEFFIAQRLRYQISLIRDESIKTELSNKLSKCEDKIVYFLNQHCQFSSLLHGDLWSGNVLFGFENNQEKVWLIDPAVYYGDREADLAMTEMFGGFSRHFYLEYDKQFAVSDAYPLKKTIYNFYHYLNHYNLFGNSYLKNCLDYLSRIKQEI